MKVPGTLALFVSALVCITLTGCGGGGTEGSSDSGGGSSNATLSISSLWPASAPQNGQPFYLSVSGSNFVSGSQVLWGETALSTTYTSASQLTALVPAADLTAQGSFVVTVTNPAPKAGTSNALSFSVGNPVPVLSAIQPATALGGSAAITLTLTGSDFIAGSQAAWNGTPLTTTYVDATTLTAQVPASDLAASAANVTANVTVINPSPNGGPSSPASFQIHPPLTYVRTINLPANDIAWDSTHGKLYASLPSSDANGNSVVAIDPVSGSVGTPVAAGSEPDLLALSDDNSLLYVSLDGAGAITRFTLPDLKPDPSFQIQFPVDPTFGPLSAWALAVAPGNPHTLAVSAGGFIGSPTTYGAVAIFDDSNKRPNLLTLGAGDAPYQISNLQWGADSSALYTGQSGSGGGDFTTMSVDSSGISSDTNFQGLESRTIEMGNIHYDSLSGFVYIDGGWVIDPTNANIPGTFNLQSINAYVIPLCVPDPEQGIVFFLGQSRDQSSNNSGVTIQAFNAKTYVLMDTLVVNGVTGYAGRFIRWGTSGLAFTMSQSQSNPRVGPIYLVDGDFVNHGQSPDSTSGTTAYAQPSVTAISPQSAVAGSAGFTFTVTGKNFFPTSTIMWGPPWAPHQLQTTFVSNTELQAALSASYVTTPGNVPIYVTDPTTGLQSEPTSIFTVLPPTYTTTSIIPMNLASYNLAWDSKSQQLILPVWGADTQYPNTVIAVNPVTGTVTHVAQVQPDPTVASATDDGSYFYTAFAESNAITRLSLPNLDAPTTWTLPTDPQYGYSWANDVRPEPGAPHTFAAVTSDSTTLMPSAGNLAIYDDGVARPETAASPSSEHLEWGAGNTQLYSGDDPDWVDAFNVSDSGLTFTQGLQIAILLHAPTNVVGALVHFDPATGYLYTDGGVVYDPATQTTVGNFNASGFLAVDDALNRVFILGQVGNGYGIESFDKTTYAQIDYVPLPDLVGAPIAFIRWGSNGLALLTYNMDSGLLGGVYDNIGPVGMLYIINDTQLVSASAVSAHGSGAYPSVHSFELPRGFPHRAAH